MCYAEKLNVHDKQQSHPFFIPSKFWQNWGKNGRGNRFAGHFADPSNPIADPLWSADHHLRATVLKHKKIEHRKTKRRQFMWCKSSLY